MTPDFEVTLGDFTLTGLEIPASLPFGGKQSLAIHKMVGGLRQIDAMGEDNAPLSWSGWFFGATALQRARYLDTVRKAGSELTFLFSELSYTVIISSFEADFQRYYQIPYKITLEVVADLTSPVKAIAPGIDTALASDLATANGLAGLLGNGPLSSLMATVSSAIGAVSSFANAAQSTINSVLQPIAAVQSQIATLQASCTNTLLNVSTLGGVLPFNPIAAQVSGLTNQLNAASQSATLFNLSTTMSRMSLNLGSVTATQSSLTVGGGNLFNVAAQQYGDATAWSGIAAANGLTDPMLAGVQTLKIPANNRPTGGVLGI